MEVKVSLNQRDYERTKRVLVEGNRISASYKLCEFSSYEFENL